MGAQSRGKSRDLLLLLLLVLMVERLSRARPVSLGAAARVAGVTPAALGQLLRYCRRAA